MGNHGPRIGRRPATSTCLASVVAFSSSERRRPTSVALTSPPLPMPPSWPPSSARTCWSSPLPTIWNPNREKR